MLDPRYGFVYIPKLIIFSADWEQILLAKRKGEADYDGTFSLIGGKMETSDNSILSAIQREKNEEIGVTARVKLHTSATHNVLFRKSNGDAVILPHLVAQFVGGKITLNRSEYSEFQWVGLADLADFEPKIDTIPEVVAWANRQRQSLKTEDYVEI